MVNKTDTDKLAVLPLGSLVVITPPNELTSGFFEDDLSGPADISIGSVGKISSAFDVFDEVGINGLVESTTTFSSFDIWVVVSPTADVSGEIGPTGFVVPTLSRFGACGCEVAVDVSGAIVGDWVTGDVISFDLVDVDGKVNLA